MPPHRPVALIARGAGVGAASIAPGLEVAGGVNGNCHRASLGTPVVCKPVTHGLEDSCRVGGEASRFVENPIRHPLVVEARRVDSLLYRETMVDEINHDLEDRVDDGSAAG